MWGGKRYADETTLRIEAAVPAPTSPRTCQRDLRLHPAGNPRRFKAAFRRRCTSWSAARLAGAEPLPDGPVVLEPSFVVGPGGLARPLVVDHRRARPAARPVPAQPEFHPRDSRIVDLGLHCAVDPALGNEVVVAFRARSGWLPPVPQTGTLPPG